MGFLKKPLQAAEEDSFDNLQSKKSEDRAYVQYSAKRRKNPAKQIEIRVGVKGKEADDLMGLPHGEPKADDPAEKKDRIGDKEKVDSVGYMENHRPYILRRTDIFVMQAKIFKRPP